MLIRAGFEIAIHVDAPTPILCALSPHPEGLAPVAGTGALEVEPPAPIETYLDDFDNRISRLVLPGGGATLTSDFVVAHDGSADAAAPEAAQASVDDLPDATLLYLMPSRFCESDLLAGEAWRRFGGVAAGWSRVQAICDFVHDHIAFGYGYGSPTKTAADAMREGRGVCRDFAHLAIALCRAMNIPARYASGYLGDIGIPPQPEPMDFCAWFEVWLGGRWHTFDARYNTPRIGRILMVRGRDAADTAMIASFGAHRIESFRVWCDEVSGAIDFPVSRRLRVNGVPAPPPVGAGLVADADGRTEAPRRGRAGFAVPPAAR
ncbi:transglutaminase family protein [Amaricoccus sp.]|uniref:transglutaminase-like domain-containing protein n=1 Tax=Amaricoccus sp. TaxID=1872485 RepID=UPI001B725304|nr:transglutaminase family protein [Amaricoccus sp.]MBP7242891.1 transglutaminase family protein [Amaricoccus sp.]